MPTSPPNGLALSRVAPIHLFVSLGQRSGEVVIDKPPNGLPLSRAAAGGVGCKRESLGGTTWLEKRIACLKLFLNRQSVLQSLEYKTGTPALKAVATIVLSQKEREYR